MTDLGTAHSVGPRDHAASVIDRVVLTYDARFLRRKVLQTEGGNSLLVDLAQTMSVVAGACFVLTDGTLVEVVAATEPLLSVTGPDLVRLAWHIGNRHCPCQVEPHRLLIGRDHVLRKMLGQLGAQVADVTEPFTPEGGAYGHGRTHGHDHEATHGGHVHDH